MNEDALKNNADFRTGFVAIVGEPNVGKSTLLNRVVGAKLSIVTRKPQTTRKSVLGILTTKSEQMIFVDTPGLLTPKYLLQERLVGYVRDAVENADVILLMLDVTDKRIGELPAVADETLKQAGKPVILLLNKMDALHDKKVALPLIDKFTKTGFFAEIIPISALEGANVDELVSAIGRYLPVGPPHYDPELISEQPQRFFVSEFIREKILEFYRQEIPYSVEVSISQFEERPEPEKIYINAEIVVEKDSQKGILIGKKGSALKRLGEAARKEIEEFLGRAIYLELFVKVRKEWRTDEARLRSFGY